MSDNANLLDALRVFIQERFPYQILAISAVMKYHLLHDSCI